MSGQRPPRHPAPSVRALGGIGALLCSVWDSLLRRGLHGSRQRRRRCRLVVLHLLPPRDKDPGAARSCHLCPQTSRCRHSRESLFSVRSFLCSELPWAHP